MSAKNVALCKALGWTVEYNSLDDWWLVKNPSGQTVRDRYGLHAASEAMAAMFVTDYEHDIAAGLAALQSIATSDQSVSVQIKIRADETLCGIEKGGQDVVVCYAATPTEAVFAALCAYYGIGE